MHSMHSCMSIQLDTTVDLWISETINCLIYFRNFVCKIKTMNFKVSLLINFYEFQITNLIFVNILLQK